MLSAGGGGVPENREGKDESEKGEEDKSSRDRPQRTLDA